MQYFLGEPVIFFESLKVAGKELGVSPSAVNNYTKGNKNYKGYTFEKLPKIKVYDIPSEMYDIRNEKHLNVKEVIEEQFREKTIARNKKVLLLFASIPKRVSILNHIRV